MCNLNSPFFNDENEARKYLEDQRWPDGPICPHCGGSDRVYSVKAKGKIRKGLYHCNDCEKQFTVTVGTVFERSKVPLHKWLLAAYLLSSSKKGISAKQIERTLGVTYKTAWFMMHRIREAMREPFEGKMGGGGHFVESDETYIGNKHYRRAKPEKKDGYHTKEKVLTLVERNGQARSFHIPQVNADTLAPIINKQVLRDSALLTDDAGHYKRIGKKYAGHASVNHSIHEYVRRPIHTNTVEGYFSILKRGINGVYQHCSPIHLKRYLAEFDFRYTFREKLGYDDMARTNKALQGIEGKRITYQGHYRQREIPIT